MSVSNYYPAHQLESEVRSYVRHFPLLVKTARGSIMTSASGLDYLDFFAGAGALNYGHNNQPLKQALLDYLQADGIAHSLDMATVAKQNLLETFQQLILRPRKLSYKVQFCGPTGTNAVEAALKLARKVTQRTKVLAFENSFHGMTLGSLAVTSNSYYKQAIPLTETEHTVFLPFCAQEGEDKSLEELEKYLLASRGSADFPAAVIVETIQGEGGIKVATNQWLQKLRAITKAKQVLLIVDDIQMACGRTGDFFSFEEAGIVPDLVTISKSISGFGLPMALLLIKPEYDLWLPAQHNGTFRGHNLAFVTATKALQCYWQNNDFAKQVAQKGQLVSSRLNQLAASFPELKVRGRGLVYGVEANKLTKLAKQVQQLCFQQRLIIETCGAQDQVLKFLPALTITNRQLEQGLTIVEQAYAKLLKSR